MLQSRKTYGILFLACQASGFFIFFFCGRIPFLRFFISDLVVVIAIYAAIKLLFPKLSPAVLGCGIFLFALLIEMAQYFRLFRMLDSNSKLMQLTLGSTFDWLDILAYGIGILIVVAAELYRSSRRRSRERDNIQRIKEDPPTG